MLVDAERWPLDMQRELARRRQCRHPKLAGAPSPAGEPSRTAATLRVDAETASIDVDYVIGGCAVTELKTNSEDVVEALLVVWGVRVGPPSSGAEDEMGLPLCEGVAFDMDGELES